MYLESRHLAANTITRHHGRPYQSGSQTGSKLGQRRKETLLYIYGMSRGFAHLAGTTSMLLTMLLWISLLDAGRADRIVDNLAGFRNEYRVVLGAGCWQSFSLS